MSEVERHCLLNPLPLPRHLRRSRVGGNLGATLFLDSRLRGNDDKIASGGVGV